MNPCWQTSRFRIDLSRPQVMGIVNATPDSFSDGGQHADLRSALAHCEQLLQEGADILDIGGESSRPGADPLPLDEELARVVPLVKEAVRLGVPVSVDTYKPEVMRAVLDLGADIVNDINALRAPGAVEAVAAHPACGVCLMHMRGEPKSMQLDPRYGDVVGEVAAELRERAEALETADRLKSEFISNVSYELRTPLNTIIGFAEILANQYFGQLNPRQLEYCRGIIGSSERLLTIINDILDLASIEAGRMTLEREPVAPRALLETVAGIMQEWARSQNLRLTVECPPNLDKIEIDERRLKQALCNLVSNAIKFTPPGGSIEIRGKIENGHALLSVSDTGIGIAAEDQERVFKEFERGRPAQARRAGAGLGLSLVKRIVELHGGHVTMYSVPNRGTTVTCVLPVTAPAAG